MAERMFIDRGSCRVWISMPEGRLRLSGQDFGGFMGTSEYEYDITVEPEQFAAIRLALGVPADADIVDAMCANADEIYTRAETTWLAEHGIPFDVTNTHHFDD
jgi:hypothetical protein